MAHTFKGGTQPMYGPLTRYLTGAMSTNRVKVEALLKLISSSAAQAAAEYEKAGGDVPSIDSIEPHPLDNAIDNIALKSAIRTLEGACAQLCTTLAPPSNTIINLVNGCEPDCVYIAREEKITDILVDYPNGIHVNDLAKIINVDAKKLVRVLRLLATRGCYSEVDLDTFANNRLSLTLHSNSPICRLVDLCLESTDDSPIPMYESMKNPETAYSEDPKHAPGLYATGVSKDTFYGWMKKEDTRRENFHYSMRSFNDTMGSLAFINQFPFGKFSTVVDVGGGIGSFSLALAKAHKHMKITLQDLPEALVQAREVWTAEYPEAVRENRIEFSELDFLTQTPVVGKDIYYLRAIIHNWADNEATLILRNIRKSMGPRSRVLIHDYVLLGVGRKRAEADAIAYGTVLAPEPLLPNFGAGSISMYHWDLTMWLMCNAKERTLENVLQLTTAAGLKLEKMWDLVETSVLEFSAAGDIARDESRL